MRRQSKKAAMAQELLLRVTGMSCSGCEDRIVETLRHLEGVRQGSADYRSGRVRVLFDPRRTTPETIQARIEVAGYAVAEHGREKL